MGIVIAGDPGPVEARREPREPLQHVAGHALGRGHVVQAVAQAPECARIGPGQRALEVSQRGEAVIRRQHLPARGKSAAFLQMQVGDDQRLALHPVERTFRQSHPALPAEAERRTSHDQTL